MAAGALLLVVRGGGVAGETTNGTRGPNVDDCMFLTFVHSEGNLYLTYPVHGCCPSFSA